jgi:hypothetical protein
VKTDNQISGTGNGKSEILYRRSETGTGTGARTGAETGAGTGAETGAGTGAETVDSFVCIVFKGLILLKKCSFQITKEMFIF